MKLVYSVNKAKVEKNLSRADFMLSNKRGCYAYFSDKPKSRYQGFFFKDHLNMFRVIENIKLNVKSSIQTVTNKCYSVERGYSDGIVESFFMPEGHSSLVYGLNKESSFDISFDIKGSYDNREFGRVHEMHVEGDKIILKFTKKTSLNEDESDGKEEFHIYVAMKPDRISFEPINEWEKRYYSDDESRKSMPYERYIYSALRLRAKNLVLSVSRDKGAAVHEADYISANLSKLKKEREKQVSSILKSPAVKKIKDDDARLAYIYALNSLEGLRVKTKREEGILAGLPWFFQIWSRDELISLKGLSSLDKTGVKNILMRYFFDFREGTLSSKLHESCIASADAVGWLYFRVNEFIKAGMFSAAEVKKITDILDKNVGFLIQRSTYNGFAVCHEKETWMDSLNRDGALIELQALRLSMYKLLFELTQDKEYKELEAWLREETRKRFWNGKYLMDSMDYDVIRPNLFIAAYVYPELLSKDEWATCFENVLPKLFLDWGGLSTIDKSNSLFVANHTGEDPKSYHNGDSWFWLNSLAAIVLSRIDGVKFGSYIKKILNASSKEIIYSGIAGCAAELSSASQLKSEGCLNQAWSNAMFIELIEELFQV